MAERLTLEQLRKEKAFLDLTPKLQKMVELFLSNGGNKVAAVRGSFNCKSEQVARVMACEVFAKAKIVTVLAVASGADPQRAAFDARLDRAIRNPKTTNRQISALRLYAMVHGYIPAASKTERPTAGIKTKKAEPVEESPYQREADLMMGRRNNQ